MAWHGISSTEDEGGKKAWILQLSKVIKSNFIVLWEEKEES